MPKVKGPANGTLFAKFDGKAKVDGTTKKPKETKLEKCLVLVSVQGNEYCNEKYLEAALKSAGSEFAQTTFLIVDDPQCFNLAANETVKSTAAANSQSKLAEARALGDTWWRQNEKSILNCLPESERMFLDDSRCPDVNSKIKTFNAIADTYNLKINFVRWQDWIDESSLADNQVFENHRKRFEANNALKQSRNQTAEKFSSRKTKKNNSASGIKTDGVEHVHDVYLNYSQQFLTEESIGVMIAGKEKGYHYVAYAGDQIEILKDTHKHFVAGTNPELMGWLNINFERRVPTTSDGIKTTTSSSSVHTPNSNIATQESIQHLNALKNKNLCLDIMPFKDKKSDVLPLSNLFQKKCQLDTLVGTKNILLIADRLTRFDDAILDTKHKFSPDFYILTANNTYKYWCNSYEDIIQAQECECLSYSSIIEQYPTSFRNFHYEITQKINKNSAFRKAFENAALNYLNELKKNNPQRPTINHDSAKIYALNAVKEKCAVIFTLAYEKKLSFINQSLIEKEAFDACKSLFADRVEFTYIDNSFATIAKTQAAQNEYVCDDNEFSDTYWPSTNGDQREDFSNAMTDFRLDEDMACPPSSPRYHSDPSESSTDDDSSNSLSDGSASPNKISSSNSSLSNSPTNICFFEGEYTSFLDDAPRSSKESKSQIRSSTVSSGRHSPNFDTQFNLFSRSPNRKNTSLPISTSHAAERSASRRCSNPPANMSTTNNINPPQKRI